MKTNNQVLRFFTWVLLLYAPLGMAMMGKMPVNDDDLLASYEHFWINYAAVLKKIKAEKNNTRAAQLVEQMKMEILPRFGQLVKITEEWKKSQAPAEIAKLENWVNSNQHGTEVFDLQTELMVRSGKEGGALGKAFAEYMQTMSAAGRK